MFKKIESKDKAKYNNPYSSPKAEIVINESDIGDVFESIYSTIISYIQKYLGSRWIYELVIDHTLSISKYNPLCGSSYIKLSRKLDHPRKELNNIQIIDDIECFKWSIARYLNHSNHHPTRSTKIAKRLEFREIKFPVKIRDIHKIEEKNFIGISVFGYEN